ncbi:RNA-binding protein [Candidatus Woesearchaeota archaeon]|nr:RNA-binding protein [Candidatus Woesearchaeota archaeon]
MENKKICSSCKKDVTNDAGTTTFLCPKCGKTEIVRCKHCREIAAKYTCPECGFNGPN